MELRIHFTNFWHNATEFPERFLGTETCVKVVAKWLSELGFSEPLGALLSHQELATFVAKVGGRPLTREEFLMAAVSYPQFVLGDPDRFFVLTDEDMFFTIGSKRDPCVPEGFPTTSRARLGPQDIAVMFMEM